MWKRKRDIASETVSSRVLPILISWFILFWKLWRCLTLSVSSTSNGLFGCLRAHIWYKHPSHGIASIFCVCGCNCCSSFGLSIVYIRINAQYRFDPYYKADALLKMPTCKITSFLKNRMYLTKSIQEHTISVMEEGDANTNPHVS